VGRDATVAPRPSAGDRSAGSGDESALGLEPAEGTSAALGSSVAAGVADAASNLALPLTPEAFANTRVRPAAPYLLGPGRSGEAPFGQRLWAALPLGVLIGLALLGLGVLAVRLTGLGRLPLGR